MLILLCLVIRNLIHCNIKTLSLTICYHCLGFINFHLRTKVIFLFLRCSKGFEKPWEEPLLAGYNEEELDRLKAEDAKREALELAKVEERELLRQLREVEHSHIMLSLVSSSSQIIHSRLNYWKNRLLTFVRLLWSTNYSCRTLHTASFLKHRPEKLSRTVNVSVGVASFSTTHPIYYDL